ncbi:TrlF family AAA-like ATPase [Citrobacter freundii]|uniref:TrlF family AAA-like ATPase n=1 Tax=Citrobacter freundii TaxID=546 RepID=UPI0019256968|nr:AAA family ATPase [Citrobacter freundii]CAD5361029.1 Histidinol phosphatase [Citrobacter freundii]
MADSFQNGSRWLKVDFHLHTKADKEFRYQGNDDRFVSDYINAMQTANIGMGIITNHNKFSILEFKALRKKARESNIGLLPGVELSVKDGGSGVHVLVVFSDEWILNKENENYIQDFLDVTFAGVRNAENENSHSNHDLPDTIRELDKFDKDYFIVFAHVEADKGLWKELSPGRILTLLGQDCVHRRVLGFQKVRTRDKRSIFEGLLKKKYPAEVEGCDAKNLTDMSARPESCYLKIGDFSFQAVKFALQEKQSRIKTELPSLKHSHITKVTFEGSGVLGGTEIHFSPELNTLIGIRGSGKSSILEGIRYALDIPFGDKAMDTGYKDGLVANLLSSGGKITVNAVCRRGQPYEIRRIYGEKPDVYIGGNHQPGLSIRETVLHKPIYFGQKDLSSTGDGFEKDLIEKLVGDTLLDIRSRIQAAKDTVTETLTRIKRLDRTSDQKQEWEDKLKDAQHQLTFYQQHGVEDKLKKQTGFDRDERHIVLVIETTKTYLEQLDELLEKHEVELCENLSYESEQNKLFFESFYQTAQKVISDIETIRAVVIKGKSSLAELGLKLEELRTMKSSLKEEFAEIERQLSEHLQTVGAKSISPTEYRQLTTLIDEAQKNLADIAKSEDIRTELNDSLASSLQNLNELWTEEYEAICEMLSAINNSDSPVNIIPEFQSDKDAMLAQLQEVFQGSNMRETTLRKVIEPYQNFGALWLDENVQGLIPVASRGTFQNYLEKKPEELLSWQVPNSYTITYRDKPLHQHSLGQRASALMLFILSQQEHDVVMIDQPEDDLDNQTIYEDVIKLIRILKPETQFIFATHNANIPVLGDAENVQACVFSNEKITSEGGSIDSAIMQQRIVAIMEGGKEAFERRKQVYDGWNA